MYLHELAEQEASFTKEEMQLGKHTEYEKRLIAYYLDVIAKEKENKSTNSKYNSTNTISISNDAGNTTETIDESSTKQQNTTQYNEDYLDLEHMNYYKGESDDNVHDSFINNEVDLHNRRTNNSKEYSVCKFCSFSKIDCDRLNMTNINSHPCWFTDKFNKCAKSFNNKSHERNRIVLGRSKFNTTQRYGYY